MRVEIHMAYEKPGVGDGIRILVDAARGTPVQRGALPRTCT